MTIFGKISSLYPSCSTTSQIIYSTKNFLRLCFQSSYLNNVTKYSLRRLNTNNNINNKKNQSENRFERPRMFQLEHIQKRVEHTSTLMFKVRLDYTFYRRSVILEDKIFNVQRKGLNSVQSYFGILSVAGQIFFPHIELQLLNTTIVIEDGTIRARWRVLYLNWIKALDVRNLKAENRIKKLKWYDGYSIFCVDGDGLVYKLTLQKVMPNDSHLFFKNKNNTTKLAEKISDVIPGATNFKSKMFIKEK